jgi:hypothetical protein
MSIYIDKVDQVYRKSLLFSDTHEVGKWCYLESLFQCRIFLIEKMYVNIQMCSMIEM